MTSIEQAIANFPVMLWLSHHTKVYDREGRNAYADCPVCDGKKTLAVWKEPKVFHCFKCDPNEGGRGGNIWNGKANLISMIKIVEHIPLRECYKKVYSLSGFPEPPPPEKKRPDSIIPMGSVPLNECHPTHYARQMLNRRGVSHLLPHCFINDQRGLSGRVIMATNFFGEVNGYEAKAYGLQKPKSIFPDWLDTWSYFYTTWNWDKKVDFCVITESYLDAETLGANAIGLYGSYLKDGQWIELLDLRKLGLTKLVWMLDHDAFLKQAKLIIHKAQNFFSNYVCNLPAGSDPNSLGRDKCWQLVSEARPVLDEFDLTHLLIDWGHL